MLARGFMSQSNCSAVGGKRWGALGAIWGVAAWVVLGPCMLVRPQGVHAAAISASTPLEIIRAGLGAQGVEGEVHAVRAEEKVFVFTWRNPANFFEFLHVSLVPGSSEIEAGLARLKRHDRIRIQGLLLDNRSPQPHVEVRGLELIRAYDPGQPLPEYGYEARLPEDLPRNAFGDGEAVFLVHAVHEGGKIVVLEYKDAVVPVFFKDPAAAAELYRNDVIRFRYTVKSKAGVPTHLVPSALGAQIRVLDSALSRHGKPADLTGALVLFPKSPQVSVDVFALHETVEGGATRQYTLANFDSPEVFKAIREKCASFWASAPNRARNGRNKWVHETIRVRAKGIFNVVDPNQANIQILLKSADDLEFSVSR
jgi:hypothetical protein